MKKPLITLLALLLGVAGATALASWNWINLIPWTLLALLIGRFSSSRKGAAWNGTLYGYLLFLAFILAGYRGAMTVPGWTRITLFALFFSLIGAALGALGAFIGSLFRKPERTQ